MLSIVEKNLKEEALKEIPEMEKLLIPEGGFITDYEMPFNISYWTENDEYISEEIFSNDLKILCSHDSVIGDDNDYGEGRFLRDIKQCYLFHSLYDHQSLKINEIIKIKKIVVQYNHVYQKMFDLNNIKKVSFGRLNEELVKTEEWINTMKIVVDNLKEQKSRETSIWKPIGGIKLSLDFYFGKSSSRYRNDDDNIYASIDNICIGRIKPCGIGKLLTNSKYCGLFNMLQEKLTSSIISGFSQIPHTEAIWADLSFGLCFKISV